MPGKRKDQSSASPIATWLGKEPGKRGPKPALSPEQIARAAIRIADANGLGAVSMERVAREVSVTTMALYRYASGKDELVRWMIDFASGPPPDRGRARRGWRGLITEWTVACAGIYKKHPWFLQATSGGRRLMGPNELTWLDAGLGILAETGLAPRRQFQALLVLLGHIRSQAEFRTAAPQGLTAKEWAASTRGILLANPDRFTALAAAIEGGAFSADDRDGVDFGLECILDGIEALIAKSRA